MKLHLIAGHGHGDNGAYGSGYCEAERVRALCATIKKYGGDNVVYHDPSHDYYAEDLFRTLNIPAQDCVLECHMDGWNDPNTRGGHVIIWHEFEPDKYDTALGDFIHSFWTGRAHAIFKRDDLKNCMISAQKNWNYRLAEFGFITCPDDINKFNDNLDYIAKKVLECFGIGTSSKTEQVEKVEPSSKPVTNASAPTKKLENATKFDNALSRDYTCTDNLNLRVGAGTNKDIIVTMPKGNKVRCFGYYTPVGSTKWLCVNSVVNGVTYTGYCSSDYLR